MYITRILLTNQIWHHVYQYDYVHFIYILFICIILIVAIASPSFIWYNPERLDYSKPGVEESSTAAMEACNYSDNSNPAERSTSSPSSPQHDNNQ